MECINKITEDSRLYKSLLSFLPKETSGTIIRSINSSEFLNKFGKLVELREGEPTVTSILNISKLARAEANIEKLLPILEKEWGLTDKSGKVMFTETNKLSSMKDLVSKAPIGHLVTLEIDNSDQEKTGLGFYTGYFKAKESRGEKVPTLTSGIRDLLEASNIPKDAINLLLRKFTESSPIAMASDLYKFLKGKSTSVDLSDFVVMAIGSTPGMSRLVNFISTGGLAQVILKESYEDFQQLYNGDESKLSLRAAATVMKSLLNGEEYKNSSINRSNLEAISRLSSLAKSTWDRTKANISTDNLNILIANAKGIEPLSNEKLEEDVADIVEAPKVKKTRGEIIADRELTSLRKALKAEVIRLQQFGQSNREFTESQRKLINTLTARIKRGQYKAGLYEIIKRASTSSVALEKRIEKLDGKPIQERMSQLRNIDSYLSSYIPVLDDIINSVDANDSELGEVYTPAMVSLLKETRTKLSGVTRQYNAMSVNTFLDFLKTEFGQDYIEIKTGARKGKYYFSDLVDNMGPDVGWSDLWLNALASSSDLIGKVLDQAFQRTEYKVYDEVINTLRNDLQGKAKLLFDSQGSRDTSWMFEKDSNGNLTGFYIRGVNYALYKEESRKALDSIRKRTTSPAEVKKEWNSWRSKNTELIKGVETPKASIYSNKDFARLSKEQQEFYSAFIELKTKMDDLVGVSDHYKAVQVRKDFIERLTSGSIKDIPSEIGSSARDALYRRVDDVGYAYKDVPTDFENNPIYSLPIYYVKMLETPSDLSTDAYASMFAYTSMAIRYERMSKLIDTLEVGKEVLSRRGAYETSGGKILRSRLQNIVKDENFFDPVLKLKEGQNAYKRVEAWMRDQVYQRGAVDQGTTVGGIDKQKLTNQILSLSTVKALGLNVMVGMASVTSGLAFTRTESIAGQFFTMKDMAKADTSYFAELLPHIAEASSPFKTNKLSLFLEKFDVSQEGLRGLRGKEIERSPIARLFGMKTLMFFLGAGDHYLRARVAIAMANNTKLKDAKGNSISLWDALETVSVDPTNTSAGSKLVLKNGVTKEDGGEFTTKDYFALSRRYGRIIQRVVGNSNEGDRAAAKQYIIGKLGMQFRNFMVPNWNARFQKSTYDVALGEETEGYYRTTGRIILNIVKELREGRALSQMNLTDLERANLKRAASDFGQFALVVLAFNLLMHSWDDKDNPWHKKFILYQLRRMQTELGAMLTPKEALNILKSPMAATSIIESGYRLATSVLWVPDWFDTIENGRFEGHSTLYKNMVMGPISPFTTFYNTANPDMLMRSLNN